MLYLASDHAGFKLKEGIKIFLNKKRVEFKDLGAYSEEPSDYPDYAFALAKKVAGEPSNRGVLCCGTGIGVCMCANKVKGIRAALVYDEFSAKAAAEHNNANVACFGGRTMKLEKVEKLLWIWFTTPFSKEERHARRLNKISEFEKGGLK